jgi:hypothetical protein
MEDIWHPAAVITRFGFGVLLHPNQQHTPVHHMNQGIEARLEEHRKRNPLLFCLDTDGKLVLWIFHRPTGISSHQDVMVERSSYGMSLIKYVFTRLIPNLRASIPSFSLQETLYSVMLLQCVAE